MKMLLPEPGPIIRYLSKIPEDERNQITADLTALLSSPQGATLLELLEKSTALRSVPLLQDTRALEALNAQSFIYHDLKRIESDHDAYAVSPQTDPQRARRDRRGAR